MLPRIHARAHDMVKCVRPDYHSWYYRKEWKAIKAQRLCNEPSCRMCWVDHRLLVPAVVVDHVRAHRGDWKLFTDYDNTQSLCKQHHDAAKQKEETRGYSTKIGLDGWPVDSRHPVYRGIRGGGPSPKRKRAETAPPSGKR